MSDGEDRGQADRGGARRARAREMRERVGVERCTLRLDVEQDYFPVVYESRSTASAR